MSRPGNTSSRCFENSVSIDITSSKWPCVGQSFTIKIFPSRSTICALISPTFSFISTSCGRCPSRICCRISGTHFGQSESVVRGQPRGGFDFSYDLSSGFSDHFGVGDGFGLTRFKRSNTAQVPLAARTAAFSTYLIGLRMGALSFSLLASSQNLFWLSLYWIAPILDGLVLSLSLTNRLCLSLAWYEPEIHPKPMALPGKPPLILRT